MEDRPVEGLEDVLGLGVKVKNQDYILHGRQTKVGNRHRQGDSDSLQFTAIQQQQ